METLLYALGFIIGALGTAFLLYFLKTRKTLRQQNELITDLILAHIGKDIAKKRKEMEKDSKKPADKEPCDCEVSKDAEPARQEPGNTAGPCVEK